MQPSRTYWTKHLVQAAIEEVMDEHRNQGYSCQSRCKDRRRFGGLISLETKPRNYF